MSKSSSRITPGKLSKLSLLAVITAGISACASAPASKIMVPENLQVPAAQQLFAETNASGVQIYTCSTSKTDISQYEWSFKAPQADLFDAAGNKTGKHYAGPTWESNDGSKVVGEVKARNDGPVASAIPWLLLTAKSTSGNGAFSKVTYIQRLVTEAGKAPADGCTKANFGSELRVPYKALYRYYTAA
jgi:hypothetical protein